MSNNKYSKLNDSILEISSSSTLNIESIESISAKTPVKLNVYGLVELNKKIQPLNVGIYHTGVEVYGTEWSYGCHPYPISAIYTLDRPRDLKSLSSDELFNLVDSIPLGETNYSLNRIVSHLSDIGHRDWTGLRYHIAFKNSINFAAAFCKFLCNATIPVWINCLPIINYKYPNIIQGIDDGFKTPLALKQLISKKIEFAKQSQKHEKSTKLRKMERFVYSNKSIKDNNKCTDANSSQRVDLEKSDQNADKQITKMTTKYGMYIACDEPVEFKNTPLVFSAPSSEELMKEIKRVHSA